MPEDIGRLELIIRRLRELDLGDPGSDSSDNGMSGGPSARARKRVASQSDEENSESDEDDSEYDSEDSGEDDEPECSDDSYGGRAVRRGAKRTKDAKRTGTTTEFAAFKNSKPRQTHSAE